MVRTLRTYISFHEVFKVRHEISGCCLVADGTVWAFLDGNLLPRTLHCVVKIQFARFSIFDASKSLQSFDGHHGTDDTGYGREHAVAGTVIERFVCLLVQAAVTW